jgi:hypothetical protein
MWLMIVAIVAYDPNYGMTLVQNFNGMYASATQCQRAGEAYMASRADEMERLAMKEEFNCYHATDGESLFK